METNQSPCEWGQIGMHLNEHFECIKLKYSELARGDAVDDVRLLPLLFRKDRPQRVHVPSRLREIVEPRKTSQVPWDHKSSK